jgi:molybdate transport system substrate-binding protein
MMGQCTRLPAAIVFLPGVLLAAIAHAQAVEIYSAGSLRAAVNEMAAAVREDFKIEVNPTFGGSGLLRERIEKGESPDLFMSADLGSPHQLAKQGRTRLPVIAFARNRMCIVSRRAARVTADDFIDRMLAPGVRVRTSTPVADPAGDYAWAIFDRIEAQRPGAGARLKDKAQALMMTTTATPTGTNPMAALFAADQIDVLITYCSGVATLTKDVPGLVSLLVPPSLDPHPVYGLAVLSEKPEALRVALFVLSEAGQAIIARAGLVPLADAPP